MTEIGTAGRNLAMLRASLCYDCAGTLRDDGSGLAICQRCGRGFRLDSDKVTERIPLDEDWRGIRCEMASDVLVVLSDGTVIPPQRDEHDQALIPVDAVAFECVWATA